MVHPKQTVVTADQVSATHESTRPAHPSTAAVHGWEIFIGPRSIGFVDGGQAGAGCWSGGPERLRKAFAFLGVPGAELLTFDVESMVTEELPVTLAEHEQMCETWNWDDRWRRGELDEYRGWASR